MRHKGIKQDKDIRKVEDNEIIELYLNRNERAISESDAKYGLLLKYIANNVLSDEEDSAECVNDTFLTAWNKIPPTIPECLKAFLGRITRDIAITRYRANHAKKRYAGAEVMLDELEECIPDVKTVEDEIEEKELSRILNDWLKRLSAEDRAVFIRRYWYGESVQELALKCGTNQNNMAQKMFSLRKKLKAELESKEVYI